MFRFVNVRELHNQTPRVLERVRRGEKAIVTSHGKPTAIVFRFTEDQIEDMVFARPSFLKDLDAAEEESVRKGSLSTAQVRRRLSL
jgi:antitoxin (DNA-binding transcriptional repressor) of toxin-antitoxin stability system